MEEVQEVGAPTRKRQRTRRYKKCRLRIILKLFSNIEPVKAGIENVKILNFYMTASSKIVVAPIYFLIYSIALFGRSGSSNKPTNTFVNTSNTPVFSKYLINYLFLIDFKFISFYLFFNHINKIS